MPKRFVVSENDKKDIRKLYNLNEQSFIEKIVSGAFDSLFNRSKKSNDIEDNKNNSDVTNLPTKSTLPSGKVDFDEVTKQVVDKVEGGYYNPKWHYKSAMGDSGETMFGIDRKHGGTLNTSSAGVQFWNLIDKNKNKSEWKHGYRGGQLEGQLLDLVSQIMQPHYETLAKKYLSPEAKSIVDNDKRLLFHFIYASWNGSGWFQKFSKKFNNSVDSGITNPDELVKVAIDSRIDSGNKLIAQGGRKIDSFIQNLA